MRRARGRAGLHNVHVTRMAHDEDTPPAEIRFLWDPDRARICAASAGAVAFFGESSLLDLIERPFAPDGPFARALAELAAQAAAGTAASGTLRGPGGPGEMAASVQVRVQPSPLPDGRPGLEVTVKGPAPGHEPAGSRLAEIARTAPAAAALFAVDGTWLAGNPACTRLLGTHAMTLDAILGDGAAARRLTGAALAEGLASATFRIATRLGPRLARVTLCRARDPETGAAAVSAFLQDIEDRARVLAAPDAMQTAARTATLTGAQGGTAQREEAARAEARALLARVGHELRTPLTAILGFAEIMADERFGPIGNAKYAEYVRDIHTGGEHLLGLVDDLLEIARSENGRRALDFEALDLRQLAGEVAEMLRGEAQARDITLDIDMPGDLPHVVGDARSMRQVLINLAGNAIKFTEPGGRVTIAARPGPEGDLTLEVADTGIGMSDDELAAALEPFGQVEHAQAGRPRGLGLGLPLARTLAEANKALFAIDSAPGAGTRARVVFPPTSVLDT